MNERFISREVISFFAHERTLYEDEQYHNCIFVGVDENEAIRKLCREFISEAKELRKPPQLYSKICDVFTSIQNRVPHVNNEQIEKLIGLLILLSKDECRKSLNEVSWDEIYEMLIREYIPYADNGNAEIRIRQIATDMNELTKVYEIPSMFNEIEVFTKPILKTAMDCIRLINYLDRKEKQCKESKH